MWKSIRLIITWLSVAVFTAVFSVIFYPQALYAAETGLDLSTLCNTAAVPGSAGTAVTVDLIDEVLIERLEKNPAAEYVQLPVKNNVDCVEITLSGGSGRNGQENAVKGRTRVNSRLSEKPAT